MSSSSSQFNVEFFISTYLAEQGMDVNKAARAAREIASQVSEHPQLIVNGKDYERAQARVG